MRNKTGSPGGTGEGVKRGNDDGDGLVKGNVFVEEGAEGGADDPIIVKGDMGEGIEETRRYAPGEELIGTEEVGNGGDLTPESFIAFVRIRGGVVLEAMGFDEGEEGPAEVGFRAGGENVGDDEAYGWGPGFGEEAGETGAETGGIDDEVAGLPVVAKTAEGLIKIGVGDILPAEAGYDAVEGKRWGCFP
jgi:hypothetical protein